MEAIPPFARPTSSCASVKSIRSIVQRVVRSSNGANNHSYPQPVVRTGAARIALHDAAQAAVARRAACENFNPVQCTIGSLSTSDNTADYDYWGQAPKA